jgi:hypothetical protein
MERDQAERMNEFLERLTVAAEQIAESVLIHIVPTFGDVDPTVLNELRGEWHKDWKADQKLIITHAEPMTATVNLDILKSSIIAAIQEASREMYGDGELEGESGW